MSSRAASLIMPSFLGDPVFLFYPTTAVMLMSRSPAAAASGISGMVWNSNARTSWTISRMKGNISYFTLFLTSASSCSSFLEASLLRENPDDILCQSLFCGLSKVRDRMCCSNLKQFVLTSSSSICKKDFMLSRLDGRVITDKICAFSGKSIRHYRAVFCWSKVKPVPKRSMIEKTVH